MSISDGGGCKNLAYSSRPMGLCRVVIYLFFDEICKRSLKFLNKCVFSDVEVVRFTRVGLQQYFSFTFI